jgi:ribosome-binding protein aMBF1 (putative translation factor)
VTLSRIRDIICDMDGELPRLPGFREMALRRMSAERVRLLADLTARRQAAGLSQTEVGARMRTSQSAVARLEAGEGDVRMSTLERYAAAVGSDITWRVRPSRTTPQDKADDHSAQ